MGVAPPLKKPSYSTSKAAIWINTALAWAVILGVVAGSIWGEPQAVALAPHVVSWMVILIMGLLGIHRFAGAADLRAIADASRAREPEPTYPTEALRQKEVGDA